MSVFSLEKPEIRSFVIHDIIHCSRFHIVQIIRKFHPQVKKRGHRVIFTKKRLIRSKMVLFRVTLRQSHSKSMTSHNIFMHIFHISLKDRKIYPYFCKVRYFKGKHNVISNRQNSRDLYTDRK